jgi:hypothetical protein
MIAPAYRDFCETLWSDWLADRLKWTDVPRPFLLDHAPEPYLRFGNGTKPMCVLFTNPGKGMEHQRREVVVAGKSCITPEMSYWDASLALATYYLRCLPKGAAKTRNEALDHLKILLGADCIVQFESLPFHSHSLPGKARFPELVKASDLLGKYADSLAEALKNVSVVVLSAVGSSASISVASVAASPWLQWQARSLLGIDPRELEMTALVMKGGKVTSGFLYQKVGLFVRGFVLTMGGNTFPSKERREELCRRILG